MAFGKNGKPKKKKGDMSKKGVRIEKDRQYSGDNRAKKDAKKVKLSDRRDLGLIPVSQENVRAYIAGCFIFRYNEPVEEEWGSCIQELQQETQCDRRTITNIFETLHDVGDFNAAVSEKERSGRPGKLPRDNPGLVTAAAAINIGVSPTQSTHICNSVNKKLNPQSPVTICRNTLMATIARHTTVVKQCVLRRKTGSRNDDSDWAVARLQRCLMTKRLLELGKLLDDGMTTWQAIREDDLLPLYLDGIAFTDQSHTRAVPAGGTGHDGTMSRHQYRIAVDATTGALCRDGVMPERRSQIRPKYDAYAQGCYTVVMPTINGKSEAKFLETFNYTGKTMVSVKEGHKATNSELDRVRKATGGGWAKHNSANPYLERYGTADERAPNGDAHILETSNDLLELYEVTQHQWYKKMRRAMKQVPISDFVLHLIRTSTDAFSQTKRRDTFMIWHDRLSILWDRQTQDWLKKLKCPIEGWAERTWADRFIRLRGQYSACVSRYYKDSLPGDSPELMPLDCHLFADIKEGVAHNVAFSYVLPDNDNDKYSLATPTKAFEAIQRTIKQGCPSPIQIKEDINGVIKNLN